MKLSAIKNRKGVTSISALALIGVISIGQSGAFIASADVVSDVTTITSVECLATSEYLVTVRGNFPTPLTEVAVNYANLDRPLWTQTATTISARVPALGAKPYIVLLQYGNISFATADVVCAGVAVAPAEETTEDGGLLPDTGSNNYNSLVAGLGLALVGVTGLLRRKSVNL
jgi:LPXTG-motif cell wall-anchored protein